MNKAKLLQLNWHIRTGLKRLGFVGVVGIGLWVFVLTYYVSVLRPAASRLEDMQGQAASLDKLTHAAGGKSASVVEQLSAFHEFFPKSKRSPELLAKVYAAAARQGVSLGQGEYRVARDQGGNLLRYEVNLPVRAEYFQIRQFLTQVLAEIPNASLDNVSFQRQRIVDPVVESQIKLTFFMEAN